MPRFLIFEDIRETRKYVVEAENYEDVLAAWDAAQEAGDTGSFIDASTISFEVQRLDDAGNVIETYPPIEAD